MKKFLCGMILGLVLAPTVIHAAAHFFYDVQLGDWYGPAVSRLKAYGIINGYQDGTFKPHQGVSRAELAVIIDRVMNRLDTEYASQAVEDYMEITLFFTDKEVMQARDCGATMSVTRYIPKAAAVADAALRELFKGVTHQEETMGMTDSFKSKPQYWEVDTTLDLIDYYQGVAIKEGIATVQFAGGAMAYLNNAACIQQSVKGPIEDTLLHFPSVSSVQYSVDGEIITGWDA